MSNKKIPPSPSYLFFPSVPNQKNNKPGITTAEHNAAKIIEELKQDKIERERDKSLAEKHALLRSGVAAPIQYNFPSVPKQLTLDQRLQMIRNADVLREQQEKIQLETQRIEKQIEDISNKIRLGQQITEKEDKIMSDYVDNLFNGGKQKKRRTNKRRTNKRRTNKRRTY